MSRRRSSRSAARLVAANARVALRPGYIGRFARGAESAPRVFLRRAAALPMRELGRPVRILIRTGVGDRRAVKPVFPSLDLKRPILDKRLRLCLARRARREVLFSKSLTGKGAHAKKVMRLESSYTCK